MGNWLNLTGMNSGWHDFLKQCFKNSMKKFNFIAAVPIAISVFFVSCGNSDSGKADKKDSTQSVLPPPADNSQATNPSLADTAYSRYDSTRKDSSKNKR